LLGEGGVWVRVGGTNQHVYIQYTHTQEGRVLEDEARERGAGAAAAVARAFVAEVCSLIDGDSAATQTRAAEALLDVVREAKAEGRRVNPALARALSEVRIGGGFEGLGVGWVN
jgi:hypothetical protein